MRAQEPSAGFRWPVSAERVIGAPAQEVWDAIARPGNLELCHPFCASNPVYAWPGPGSHDEVHYLSGWTFERHFHEWIDGVGYDLEIGRSKGGKSLVSWRIEAISEQSCSLRITVCPHALQHLPVVVRWIPHALWMRPMLRKYLDSVVRGVEWFVTRSEAVPRNAFGTHPWFSAR
jgi:hypothetical protein